MILARRARVTKTARTLPAFLTRPVAEIGYPRLPQFVAVARKSVAPSYHEISARPVPNLGKNTFIRPDGLACEWHRLDRR